jgi:pilus assembly protein CpaE
MLTQIMVVNDDLDVCNALQKFLTQNGFEVIICISAEAALEQTKRQLPHLVIVDVVLPGMNGLALCRTLRQDPATHSIPIIILSGGGMTDKSAGFEAGADDYMVKPFELQELVYRVKNLLTRNVQVAAQPAQKQTARGKIITVFAPKGGVGKTTVAINLAVALKKSSEKQVVIMDADFCFGMVGVNLNLSSTRNILILAENFALLDEELVQQVLISHESGIRVLLCPLHPEDADTITSPLVESTVDILSQMNAYIVVDCHNSYDERTLLLLDKSDIILLVVTPEIGTLMSTKRYLDLVERLDMHPERIQLVLNRFNSKVGYEKANIERALKINVKYSLVSGGREVVMSANKGIPLVMQLPKHPFSLGIFDIAKHILSDKIVHKE